MKVDTLALRNLRRFEHFRCTFQPSFTVLIGENGAGKTTILELLRGFLSAWTPSPVRVVSRGDIRETIDDVAGAPTRNEHRPWMLHVDGVGFDGLPYHVQEGDLAPPGATVTDVAVPRARRYHVDAAGDHGRILPLLAYFSPWREKPRARKPRVSLANAARRLDGYTNALDLQADFNDFAAWFKSFELLRMETGRAVPSVEAVRRTVISCIPDCTDLRWLPVVDEIVATVRGTPEPIWRLSDGFRTMLALVGEIAWRAAILNPALGENVAQQVNGVVLIDELDLHLHPRWQRRVVDDLRRAFPQVQFIATTHSPFVVQSMRADEVINLDRRPSLDYQSASVEDIAEVEMGLDNVTRSLAFREKVEAAKQYLEALEHRPDDEQGLRALKDRLDETQERFGADPAFVALLMRKRAARGLE